MIWNLNCDPWVSWSFLQNKNPQAVNKMKRIENRKNIVKKRWDFEGIFTCYRKCVSVCGCVRLFVWVIVAYYCVSMCWWHIV